MTALYLATLKQRVAQVRTTYIEAAIHAEIFNYLGLKMPEAVPAKGPGPVAPLAYPNTAPPPTPEERQHADFSKPLKEMGSAVGEAVSNAVEPVREVARLAMQPRSPEDVEKGLKAAELGKFSPDAAAAALSLRDLGAALALPPAVFLGTLGAVWSGGMAAAQKMLADAGLGEQHAGEFIEAANLVGAHMMASVPEIVIPPAGSRYLPFEGEVIPPAAPRAAPAGWP